LEISKLKKGSSKTLEDRKDWKLLSSSFRAFLTDASAFYLRLVQLLIHIYQLDSVKDMILKPLKFAICEESGIN
jgi:hypothetical protein